MFIWTCSLNSGKKWCFWGTPVGRTVTIQYGNNRVFSPKYGNYGVIVIGMYIEMYTYSIRYV